MARALFGHLPPDTAGAAVLGAENARLRARVLELESLVDSLLARNDLLAEEIATARLGESDGSDLDAELAAEVAAASDAAAALA